MTRPCLHTRKSIQLNGSVRTSLVHFYATFGMLLESVRLPTQLMAEVKVKVNPLL
jgi:hypothetical protein